MEKTEKDLEEIKWVRKHFGTFNNLYEPDGHTFLF